MLLYICKIKREREIKKSLSTLPPNQKNLKIERLGIIMEKITKRQMYTAMINYAENGSFSFETDEGTMVVAPDEIVTFAENEISLLDKKAAKAKETAAKKKTESDALMDAVAQALSEDFEPIADIAARIEGDDVTVSKVTYRLNKLVENGVAEKQAIKVPGSDGKKNRSIQGYRLAAFASIEE